MPAISRRSARLGLTAIACAVLAACGSLDGATGRIAGVVTPYKVEIVQGNFVSREQVEALQRGMTRSQVKEVLGTPLMTSVFHADRWDYVFTLKRQGVAPQSRKLTLFFQGDQLDKWDGDPMPSEAEFVAQLDSRHRAAAVVPLLEVPEEVLKDFNLKNPPAPRAESSAVAVPSAAAYPPLEAPGTTTQAWDASTQRAVVAATASRPPAPSLAPAPAAVPVAAATSSAAVMAASATSVAAPVAQSQTVAPAAAPSPTPSPSVSPLPTAVAASAAVSSVPVTQAPPVAAPVPQAALPTLGFVDLDPEVTTFLNGWMNDWQSRNSAAYFSRYVPEFKGTSASRAEWEGARRATIDNGRSVSIAVQDVRGVMISPAVARVVFRQIYDSDAGSEIGTKALFLVKRDGRWLIEREFFTPIAP